MESPVLLPSPAAAPSTSASSECVGRDRELGQLDALLGEVVSDGRGRMVWISGPSGIGKTRLARAALDRIARVAGSTVVALPFTADAGDRPYRCIDALLEQVEPPLRRAGKVDLCDRIGRLRAQLQDGGERQAEADRAARRERIAEVLGDAAAWRPLVIVVQDFHALDEASLAAWSHVARTRLHTLDLETPVEDRLRALLVVTSREAAGDWTRGTALTSMALGALDEAGVRAFLSADDIVAQIASVTGGRPGALRALLESALRPASTAAVISPESIPAESAFLARCLTQLDRAAPLRLVEVIVRAEGLSADAIESVVTSGLARRDIGDDGSVRFVPAAGAADLLAPSSTEAALNQARRVVARALREMGGGDEAVLAAELLLSAGAGEEAVDAALIAGLRLEATFALERAVSLYRRAHALTAREAVRASLEERLVALQRMTGDFDGALSDGARLVARRPGDPATLRMLGQLHVLTDDFPAARDVLSRARGLLLGHADGGADTDGVELPRVIAAFAEVCLLEGRHADAIAECEVGLASLGRAGASAESIRLVLELRNTLGKVHLAEARYADAGHTFGENLAEAQRRGLTFEEARARTNLGIALLRLGRFDEAERSYRAALEIATAAEDHRHRAFCLQNLGVLALQRADFSTALELLRRAAAAFHRSGQPGRLAWVVLDIAALYLDLGAVGEAQRMALLAERVAERRSAAMVRHKRLVVEARIALCEGDHERARRCLVDARDGAAHTPEPLAEVFTHLAGTELEAGDLAAAQRLLDEADAALARNPPSEASIARLRLCAGEVHLSRGDGAAARRALLEASEAFQRFGNIDCEWRCHFALARVARLVGDPIEARRRTLRASQLEAQGRDRVPESLRALVAEDPVRRALASHAEAAAQPAVEERAAMPSNAPARVPAPVEDRFGRLIGHHPRMQKVFAVVERVARFPSVVLVRGESGTGKELIAEALHERSERAAQPFVKVNCAALVETLLLSELFGHERGAFTGAVQRKKGRFEAAQGGTLFLDEIGDVSPRTQAALLRVLQEREFERVGSTQPIKVDVRIVCATNRDLEAMVARGEFREDLYYRLNGIQIDLPPLRDHAEDVPLIATDLLARVADERGAGPRRLSPEAATLLMRYGWPGNVRELENVIRSVTLFVDGDTVHVEDLRAHRELAAAMFGGEARGAASAQTSQARPATEVEGAAWERLGAEGIGLRELQERIEIECIVRALGESGGNITRAAEILKMKRPRLSQLIKEHGIALPRDEGTTCVS